MQNKIRVVIVDDSAFMRKSLSIMLESDPDIEIIGTGKDGIEAINLAKTLRPDIMTLDIEMPKMDGLTALKKIMAEAPTSVLMVSSLTSEGADATMKALELGAVDFIPKDLSFVSVNIINIKEDLINKVKAIVKHRAFRSKYRSESFTQTSATIVKPTLSHYTPQFSPRESLPKIGFKAVAIGISTGGPMSLQQVIPKLNKNIPAPVFIVQHMPPKFTKSLADRLNSLSQIEVKEAEDKEIVRNGVVYIAPGGFHMMFTKVSAGVQINISEEPSDTLHRPSVDVMLNSAVRVYNKYVLSVIMTGMGKDGFEAVKDLKGLGGYAIAQDEISCIVYGMPKAIVEGGFADVIAPLDKISDHINKVF